MLLKLIGLGLMTWGLMLVHPGLGLVVAGLACMAMGRFQESK